MYASKPTTIKALKFTITNEFHSSDQQKPLCKEVCDSVLKRGEKYIEINGPQFGHLL